MARIIRGGTPSVPSPTYTLRDLLRRTGLRPRTLQDWSDAGVLVAEGDTLHAGRGVSRKFSLNELVVATLLAPLSTVGIPIGPLARTADVLRQALRLEPGMVRGIHYEEGAPDVSRALTRAMRGVGQNFLLLAYTDEMIVLEPLFDEADEPATVTPAEFFKKAGPDHPAPKFAFLLDLSVLEGIFER